VKLGFEMVKIWVALKSCGTTALGINQLITLYVTTKVITYMRF